MGTKPVQIQTPGKVNLVLDVLERRPDGYHEIRSLMVAVGLYDRVTIEPAPAGQVVLTCDHASVPTDETNLMHRAAVLLAEHAGQMPGCRIHLEKRIPIGGGMGGGSSNAAGVLRALNHCWNVGLAPEMLMALGARIGSDVPFFLAGGSAIVTGRGECVRPTPLAWKGWVALAMVDEHVSTPAVYARCTPQGPENHRQELAGLLQAEHADALYPLLGNGLEPAVFSVAPEVRRMQAELSAAGGRPMRVSGAGSVLFDVCDTEAEARAIAQRISRTGLGAAVAPAPVTVV